MKYTETEVIIPGEQRLSGTITVPANTDKKLPAILIIVGSGGVNRDGNQKRLNLNLYNKLAEKITEHGYIILRYDKRGIGKSEGDRYEVGTADLLTDVIHAIQFLKTVEKVDQDKIFLLGHSEGALLAPAVYIQEKVKGLILLCGTTLSGKEILSFQVDALAQEISQFTGVKRIVFKLALKVQKWLNNKVLNKSRMTDKSVIRFFGMKFAAKWLREFSEYNVCEYLNKVDCQTLVISGGKDIQVDPNEASKIEKLIPGPVKSIVLSNMNHILRNYNGQHHYLSLIKEYKESANDNLSKELTEELYVWLDNVNKGVNSQSLPRT